MEGIVALGPIHIGLPGIISLAMFMSPLADAVPRILNERAVGKLPLLPYSAMVSAGIVWAAYGWLTNAATVFIVNVISVLLGLLYCRVFCRFCPADADWLPFKRHVHFAGISATVAWCMMVMQLSGDVASLALGLTGNVLCIIMFGGPLTAVRTIISEQSTRSLPFGFTCIVTANGGIWVIYSLMLLHDPMVLIPNLLGFLLGLLQLSLFVRFGFHQEAPVHKYRNAEVSEIEAATIGSQRA